MCISATEAWKSEVTLALLDMGGGIPMILVLSGVRQEDPELETSLGFRDPALKEGLYVP